MRTVGASRCTNTANHGRLRPAHEPRSRVRGARRISSDERTAVARQLIICLCRGLIHHLFVLAALAVAVGACAGAAGGAAGGGGMPTLVGRRADGHRADGRRADGRRTTNHHLHFSRLIHHLFVLAALAVGARAGAAGGAAGGAACRRSSRGRSSRDQSPPVNVYDHDIGNIINIDKKIVFDPITRRIPWATYQPRRTTTVHSALAPSAVGAVGEGLGLHHSTAACSQTALGRGTPKNGRLVYFGAGGA